MTSSQVTGVVSELAGDCAIVEIAATTGCGRCHEPGGCGGGLLTGEYACKRRYRVPNPQGVQPGDQVVVSIPEGRVLSAALWIYGLPMLLGLIAAGGAAMLWQRDAFTIIASVLGFVLGFVLLKRGAPALEGKAPLSLQRADSVRSEMQR